MGRQAIMYKAATGTIGQGTMRSMVAVHGRLVGMAGLAGCGKGEDYFTL
jgi:hypothetical protein